MSTPREEMKKYLTEHPISEEQMKMIIHRYDLDNVNLTLEKQKINEKKSNLSARQRKAVIELTQVKDLMDEIEKDKDLKKEAEETVNFSTI